MKSIKTILLPFVLLTFFFASCEKEDSPTIIIDNNISPTLSSQLNKFFEDNNNEATQLHSVSSSSNIQTIYTNTHNYSISFGPSTFNYSNGTPVSGDFTIEIIEAISKKEMMMLNKPTFTNDGQLLVSGGIIYLNAMQGNQQLSINDANPVIVSIPTNEYVEMELFDGSFDENNDFGWDTSEDNVTIVIQDDSTNVPGGNGFFSYNFSMDSIGWINCDYFYNSTDPLTGVNVILPDDFNGSNSIVFIYYTDINSVANMNDYDQDSNFDLGLGYSTPVGMDISFVVIAEIDSTFYYNIVSNVTLSENHIENIDNLIEVTEEELQTIIDNI